MKYLIRKSEHQKIYFGVLFVVLISIVLFIADKLILGIILLSSIFFALFTGTTELEISDEQIIVCRGLLKRKTIIQVANIKSFYMIYLINGVTEMKTTDNKKTRVTFGRFDNWSFIVRDIYNNIKNNSGIDIDEKIKEIVNANN